MVASIIVVGEQPVDPALDRGTGSILEHVASRAIPHETRNKVELFGQINV